MTGRAITTCLAALVAALTGCGLDGGLKPLESNIRGQIVISGAVPEELQELRVVVFECYPAPFSELTVWSDPLPLGVSTIDYTLPVPPGEYALVALAGRRSDTGWAPLVVFNPTGGSAPDTVRVSDRTTSVIGVDFAVVFSSGQSGIRGTLTFVGAWPDTVSSIRVGALSNPLANPPYPSLSLADIPNLSTPFTRDSTSFAYAIPLVPRTYPVIAVSWMSYDASGNPEDWAASVLKLFERPLLGVYAPANPALLAPEPVAVPDGAWVEGVDIVVDFGRTSL